MICLLKLTVRRCQRPGLFLYLLFRYKQTPVANGILC